MPGGDNLYKTGAVIFSLSKWMVLFIVGLMLVHLYIGTIFMVDGISMEPNFHTGQIVFVNRISFLINSPQRGDVVVLRFPGDEEKSKYIKRVVGLPGERIEFKMGKLYVDGKLIDERYLAEGTYTEADNYKDIKLKKDEYMVVGDNREASSDSRIWGPARTENMIGRTRVIIYPFKYFGYLADVFY